RIKQKLCQVRIKNFMFIIIGLTLICRAPQCGKCKNKPAVIAAFAALMSFTPSPPRLLQDTLLFCESTGVNDAESRSATGRSRIRRVSE
ncbi:hypothetical protein, partial [Erwinia amylovora]|uniref:hypothetical protein n=1 Tax=Erwinia amylovora TaxID=552 RepID=UPI0020C023C6